MYQTSIINLTTYQFKLAEISSCSFIQPDFILTDFTVIILGYVLLRSLFIMLIDV